MKYTLVAVLFPLFASANCDEAFFTKVRNTALVHMCQLSLSPNCHVDPPNLKNSAVTAPRLAAGGLTARNFWKAYGDMHRARSEVMGRQLRQGTYHKNVLRDRLYGGKKTNTRFQKKKPWDISKATKERAKQTTQRALKRGAKGRSIAVLVFGETLGVSLISTSEQCAQSQEGYFTTQKVVGNSCTNVIAYSENVERFLSLPAKEQAKLGQAFPSICSFYKELYKQASQDLQDAKNVQLIDYQCQQGRPLSYVAKIGDKRVTVVPTSNRSGVLTGLNAEANHVGKKFYKINFDGPHGAKEILSKSRINGPVSRRKLSEMSSSQFAYTKKIMGSWWAHSDKLSRCCKSPSSEGCDNTATAPQEKQSGGLEAQ